MLTIQWQQHHSISAARFLDLTQFHWPGGPGIMHGAGQCGGFFLALFSFLFFFSLSASGSPTAVRYTRYGLDT
jgi:hypothetical protein